MNLKTNLIKATGALIAVALMSVIYASQPEETQPQVVITSDSYIVKNKACNEYCTAKVQADEYEIFVEYRLDDASVEFLDILNVVRHDKTINAYIDHSEIQKINAAIVGARQ